MQRMGPSLIFMQPMKDGKPAGTSLMVELQSGTVGMAEHSMPLQSLGEGAASPERIWGIIGLARLVNCAVLAVITSAEQVPVPSLLCLVTGQPGGLSFSLHMLFKGSHFAMPHGRWVIRALSLVPSLMETSHCLFQP